MHFPCSVSSQKYCIYCNVCHVFKGHLCQLSPLWRSWDTVLGSCCCQRPYNCNCLRAFQPSIIDEDGSWGDHQGTRRSMNWCLSVNDGHSEKSTNSPLLIAKNENVWAFTYLPRPPHVQSFCPKVLLPWWYPGQGQVCKDMTFKVIGQTVWPWECSQTHTHSQLRFYDLNRWSGR